MIVRTIQLPTFHVVTAGFYLVSAPDPSVDRFQYTGSDPRWDWFGSWTETVGSI